MAGVQAQGLGNLDATGCLLGMLMQVVANSLEDCLRNGHLW